MSVLKVGDKLKVMVDHPKGANERVGNILTVTKPDGHDLLKPDVFCTDSTDPAYTIGWTFRLSHITDGSLMNMSSTPVNNSTTNPVQFKIGDITEWFDGSQYEIVGEDAFNFEICLIRLGSVTSRLVIGSTVRHGKGNFFNCKLVGHNPRPGFTNSISASGTTPRQSIQDVARNLCANVTKSGCECGAHKVKDHLHSNWCPEYVATWRSV